MMKIALTKNYNVKRKKNANFRTPLSERNNSWKSPQGDSPPLPPPPPSPAVNHPPHAKMKHTGEADALITEFAARWRARKEHLRKLYSTKYEEKESRKRMTYSSTSQTNTPTHNHANSFNTCCKFITIYRIQQKEYSSAWAAAGKSEWQENNFMKLIISIWWLHLCQKIQENCHNNISFLEKTTPIISMRESSNLRR